MTTTLKKYVLQDEIPNQYRSYVWQKLIFQLVRDIRSDNKGGGGDGYGETFNYYQSKLDLKETLLEGDKVVKCFIQCFQVSVLLQYKKLRLAFFKRDCSPTLCHTFCMYILCIVVNYCTKKSY